MANDAGAEFILPVHHQTFALSSEPYLEPISRLYAAAGNQSDRVAARRHRPGISDRVALRVHRRAGGHLCGMPHGADTAVIFTQARHWAKYLD